VAIAAALATMDVLEREGIANAATMGEVFFSRLHDWPSKHPIVGEVRGRGLMIGVEIVKSQQTREPAPVLRDRIVSLAFEQGLLLLGCGETSIRLAPPLIVNQHEATIGLDIFEKCVAQVEQEHARAVSFASATV
jgi:4-aminobutyrate aminotransferase